MKKKVRKALKEVRNGMVFGRVDFDNLETLVEWAEKKAKVPEKLEVGDAVRLVKDIPHGGTVIKKGTTGKVRALLSDPAYDVEIYMHVVDRYSILPFTFNGVLLITPLSYF